MNLVIDANILFAALIKNSRTVKLLLNRRFTLYAPQFILDEFKKHKSELLGKTYRNSADFEEIMNILREIVILIPYSETEEFLEDARKICPDKNDLDYFALALKFNCPIWSNDNKLKEQDRVKIYSTKDLITFLELA